MSFLKKLIPEALLKFIRPLYHGSLAYLAALYYGRPSKKLIVIGITGTTGKSTTVAMLSHILNQAGKKTGYMTTVNFFDGEQLKLNKHGLSMSGGPLLQRQLRQMLHQGCKYAIVECTSEGLAQNRHLGINFDVALFTNLSHAHIDAHGSFANYQKSKGKLFLALSRGKAKKFFAKKMLGANLDDPMSGYFLSFNADQKFGVTFTNIVAQSAQEVYQAKLLDERMPYKFSVDGVVASLNMLGKFNTKNAALALACADMLGVSLSQGGQSLSSFHGVAGRMELVLGSKPIEVIVDYGCEPASIKSALEEAAQMPHKKLIHVFGSTGGHRDKQKRFEFGRLSAQYADQIVVTNDDVYDSDPKDIANNIEQGILSYKIRKPKYEIILDRRRAIVHAINLAEAGDLVLITGKGSEQFLVLPKNQRIIWDDRQVVKEALQ